MGISIFREAKNILKSAFVLWRTHGLVLLPFALLGASSSFLNYLYTEIFSASMADSLGLILITSLGLILGFVFKIALFLQVNACVSGSWLNYKQALTQGFKYTPRVLIGYLLIVLMMTLFMLFGSSFLGSIGNGFFKTLGIVFFIFLLVKVYVRFYLYYQNILLKQNSVWRAFFNSFKVMSVKNNRRLTLMIVLLIPCLYIVGIFLPICITMLAGSQSGVLNLTLDTHILNEAFLFMQQKKVLTSSMQAQITLFFNMLQNITVLYTIFAAFLKPMIHALWIFLFNRVSGEKDASSIEIDTSIKV